LLSGGLSGDARGGVSWLILRVYHERGAGEQEGRSSSSKKRKKGKPSPAVGAPAVVSPAVLALPGGLEPVASQAETAEGASGVPVENGAGDLRGTTGKMRKKGKTVPFRSVSCCGARSQSLKWERPQ